MLASERLKHSDLEKARGRCELGKALEIGRLWEVADHLKAASKGWLFNLNTFKSLANEGLCPFSAGGENCGGEACRMGRGCLSQASIALEVRCRSS